MINFKTPEFTFSHMFIDKIRLKHLSLVLKLRQFSATWQKINTRSGFKFFSEVVSYLRFATDVKKILQNIVWRNANYYVFKITNYLILRARFLKINSYEKKAHEGKNKVIFYTAKFKIKLTFSSLFLIFSSSSSSIDSGIIIL